MDETIIVGIDDEFESFEEFIEYKKLQEKFNNIETLSFDDYNPDYIQDKYGSDIDAVEYYIQKFIDGKWYVRWDTDDYKILVSEVEI